MAASFPGSEVRTVEDSPGGDTIILIRDGACDYTLRIDSSLAGTEDFEQLLEDCNAVEELRRSEGMPLILSAAGVRLASSN